MLPPARRGRHQDLELSARAHRSRRGNEPVFALNNHLNAATLDLPGPAAALQHLLELPVLRSMPCLAHSGAVAARKGE